MRDILSYLAGPRKQALAFTGCLLVAATSVTAQTSPGTAGSDDPFEVNGMLYSGSAPTEFLLGDGWAQGTSFLGVLDADGLPANNAQGFPFRAYRQIDGNWGNMGDGMDMTLFAGSNKNLDLIGATESPWEWDAGAGGPQKNDITNAYFHTRVDPTTKDRWVFVAAETRSTNGDSHVDFEFNQAGIVRTGDEFGEIIGLGPDGGRTVNDFLISVDFEQGGENPVASIRFWDGVEFQLVELPGTVFSATNLIDIPHGADGSWKHYTSDGAKTNILTRLQFVEAGVNLSALDIGVNPCATDATFMAKTRSSASWTADLKDFALVTFPLEALPELQITAPEAVCTDTEFEVGVTELTGLPFANFEWSVSGCGEIVGTSLGDTITVRSLESCGCTIDLRASVTAGECAHATFQDISIVVGDDDRPTLSEHPEDDTVECDAIPPAPFVTATDDCTASAVEFGESQSAGSCSGQSTIVRTWQSTDDCGNMAEHAQTLSVVDTSAPTLSGVPADSAVSCDAIPAPAEVSSGDNCSESQVSLEEIATPGDCAGMLTITRTWTATDDCGNQTSDSQVLLVMDDTAPILAGVPADVTLECDSLPLPATVTASDNCSEAIVDFEEFSEAGGCSGEAMILRTWTATDDCGNSDSQTQIITLEDTTAPTLIGVPADTTVECDSIPDPPEVTAEDNCSTPIVTLDEDFTAGEGAGKGTIRRTWTATDDCGNQNSQIQLITVIDSTAPVLIDVPEDITVECDDIPAAAEVTATDNCAVPSVTLEETSEPGECEGRLTIVRAWTAVDDCGNEVSGQQIVSVVDTSAPSLANFPGDSTVSCDDIPAPADVTATDNCAPAHIDFSESAEPGACVGETIITRVWTATDACGNQESRVQSLLAQDVTAPGFSSEPADTTAECDDVPPAETLTASDNCDEGVAVTLDEVSTPGSCDGEYEILRTWSTADDCNNQSTVEQLVSVSDTTGPQISLVSDPTKYLCDDNPVTYIIDAVDNCSDIDLRLDELRWITATNRVQVTAEILDDGTARITATGPAHIYGSLSANDSCGNFADDLPLLLTVVEGQEACSQGFWKNHYERWGPSGFSPTDNFVGAFGITDFGSPQIPGDFSMSETLGEAINRAGGGFNQALVQGTAALINAAHPAVDFPLTPTEVRLFMQRAFSGEITFDAATALFNFGNDAERECGCPIS
ncbi:MAG: HYR-like domain-containing protein [Planctomycetota bacterium]